MHTTLLVFSYPKDAQYSQLPSEYEGEAIEDYSVQLTELKPELGQFLPGLEHSWVDGQWSIEERLWQVGKIHQYQAVDDSSSTFSIAVLTFDGSAQDMGYDPEKTGDDICQVLLTPEGPKLSWPEHVDYMAEVGTPVYQSPYEVAQVTRFGPAPGEPFTIYNIVNIGWCIPVSLAAEGSKTMATA